jgi:hypothetical protein
MAPVPPRHGDPGRVVGVVTLILAIAYRALIALHTGSAAAGGGGYGY